MEISTAYCDLVHRYNKPFLLHSCGQIFSIMEDLIQSGIDAKHSNEDQIAPFSQWVEMYGDRIGNFGGLDVDAVCQMDRAQLKEYILDILHKVEGHGGIAIGTGNSIPNYVPADGYRILKEDKTPTSIGGELRQVSLGGSPISFQDKAPGGLQRCADVLCHAKHDAHLAASTLRRT